MHSASNHGPRDRVSAQLSVLAFTVGGGGISGLSCPRFLPQPPTALIEDGMSSDASFCGLACQEWAFYKS